MTAEAPPSEPTMRQEVTMSRLLSTVLALILAVAALAGSAAHAQDASAAQAYLRSQHTQVQQLMRHPVHGTAAVEARKTQLTRALSELLDYTELAHRALGEHEAQATPAQRAAFEALLRQLVERSYQKSLESTVDYEVRYLSADAGATGVTVRTVARSRSNGREPEVSIDYSLHQVAGAWRVFDVATDGVSLVRNYRSQFHRIVVRNGIDALLAKMRERLANEGDL